MLSVASATEGGVMYGPPIPFGHPSLKPDTHQWVHALIRDRLGYPVPQSWQVDGVVALLTGTDLFAIIRTGGGKSLLLQATMVAVQAKAELVATAHSQSNIKRKRGILCVPTKVLANEQVSPSLCHNHT